MKRNMFLMALSTVMAVLISVSAFAADYVYVTKNGKRYHKEGSRFIKNKEVEKMTREEAEERGYKPSSEILKDDAKAAEADNE